MSGSAARVLNAGPVLDRLLADAHRPGWGRQGRLSAQRQADRFAAGLPVVRKRRWEWEFVCPVCGVLRGDHETVRACRDAWLAHVARHDGFTPSWPEDLVPEPEEPPTPIRAPRGPRKPKPSAQVHVVEPAGHAWWDGVAPLWIASGCLRRVVLSDGRSVAVFDAGPDFGFAVRTREFLAGRGLDLASITVYRRPTPVMEQASLFDLAGVA